MKAKAEITFADVSEAARYLAGYTSAAYENPETAAGYHREFPLETYDSRLSSHIAEAAALMLYERFCTDRGRTAARQAVCGVKPDEVKAEPVRQTWYIPANSWKPVGGDK